MLLPGTHAITTLHYTLFTGAACDRLPDRSETDSGRAEVCIRHGSHNPDSCSSAVLLVPGQQVSLLAAANGMVSACILAEQATASLVHDLIVEIHGLTVV
jgi:hypothetical protein